MALISGLEKYIGSVGKTYDRTVGVSKDTDEWKKNFADVLVDGDIGSELQRTAKVIADRMAKGLDTSAQETYKAQLLDASNIINNGSGMESKQSTYQDYGTPESEKTYLDNPRYQNAIERIIGPTNYEKMTNAVGTTSDKVVKVENTPVNITAGGTNWTKLALIGGGALIAAAFVKGLMD